MTRMSAPVDRTAEATARRERCEAEILQLLKQLCVDTGLDLDRVQVLTVVDTQLRSDDPHVIPYAVKIVLCV
jgi:hypothetical protein